MRYLSSNRLPANSFPVANLADRICTVTKLLTVVAILLSAAAGSARGDIYRFVSIDGVETFTDSPDNRQAKLIARDSVKKQPKRTSATQAVKIHTISLNEIVEKTVQASIATHNNGQNASIEPRLPAVGGTITSGVGMRIDPIDGKLRHHNGIDIALQEGTPVTPAAQGVIVYSGLRSGYGNTVLIEHDNGMVTLYGHNSRLMVSAGQSVDRETIIALSGNTGRSTGPHLHFEAWHSGSNITPIFMPENAVQRQKIQLASYKPKTHFRKEIMTDGTLLFTNIPSSTP